MSYMVVNAMWFGTTPNAPSDITLGPISFSYSQIGISLMSAVLTLPLNLTNNRRRLSSAVNKYLRRAVKASGKASGSINAISSIVGSFSLRYGNEERSESSEHDDVKA